MGLTQELENEISFEFSSESTNQKVPHVKYVLKTEATRKQQESKASAKLKQR